MVSKGSVPVARSTGRTTPRNPRGATLNPPGRFEVLHVEPDADAICDPDDTAPAHGVPTLYFHDASRSIISSNTSPDVPFDRSVNPYRGCEHGCIYCYARPTHEYLGLSAGLDFETRILVKPRAPELLRAELSRRSWKPRLLAMSGVTDPYQPIERRLQLTRRCLEVLAEFRNPVGVITKSALVTRDLDVLAELAAHRCVTVTLSITTLDEGVRRAMEPRASDMYERIPRSPDASQAGTSSIDAQSAKLVWLTMEREKQPATVGTFEAKTHLSALLERVAKGETITITRNGVPVARLAPLTSQNRRPRLSHREVVDGMRALRERIKPGTINVRDLIKEGRGY